MALSVRLRRRSLLAAAVAAAVTVGAFVLIPILTSDRDGDKERARGEVAEFIKEHPEFRNHRTAALAFLTEKLSDEGGEASQEIVNGPAQEEYAARAYPHSVIGNTQVIRSRKAYASALSRADTSAGRRAQAKALDANAVRDWQPIGPDGGTVPGAATYTGTPSVVSGRTTALAFGSGDCTASHCVLFAGTAGGGVWRTTDALSDSPQWAAIGADIPSTAIGSLLVTSDGTLYVGTGEANGSSDSEAGRGLYRSTDGGDSFSQVPTVADSTDFTLNRSIASIAVDPSDSDHLLVGTAVARHGSSSVNGGRFTPPGAATLGLYESSDGGQSWHLALSKQADTVNPGDPTGGDFFRADVTKIEFDPVDPSTVYASISSYGLFRRTGTGSWQRIYKVAGKPADLTLDNRVEFATTELPNGNTRVYLGDSTMFGSAANGFVSGLVRTNNARTGTPAWKTLSNKAPGTPGFGSYNFCQTQCTYDMVVSTPPGKPDTVYLSGSMNYDELFAANQPSNGRAVVRSTDAGAHFTDMTNDAAGNPNGLHPDQHALVFVPDSTTEQFVVADDGGINRESGPFVDASSDCNSRGLSGAELKDCKAWLSAIPTSNTQLNDGLQTLQYQSVSVSPDGVVQGGTQDNGTWESDGPGFFESVGGDGGQSGFDAANPDIRYHSYFAPDHDVNFNGSDPLGWDFISDPLDGSGEAASFYTPFTADPVNPGYVYDGLQHVWRTTDHGGDPDYLQKFCNELTGDYNPEEHPCGDWKPLGGDNGDLSGTHWGDDTDSGNYVIAIERAASNPNTMWAATRYGRLFVSTNANASDPADVSYTRLDKTLGLPQRFVSSISIDPANPYHIWVSYSGYSAYSPGGHVFEVNYDPETGQGTAKDLSNDLGDQPVTAVRYSPTTGALFAATDFGVLTLPAGGDSWVATTGLPQVAVYGLTMDSKGEFLYAATHGRSIWKLRIS